MAPPLTPSAGQLVADKSPSPSATIVEEHDEVGHCKHFTMHESQIPAWLDKEQKVGNFRFVQCGGKKKRVRGWYCKYVCHCYGRPEIKAKDKIAVLEGRVAKNTRKSKKVGCPCAAYVTCDIDGTATIRYFPMHHGHELTKKSARKHSRRVARNSSSESSSTTLPTEPLSPSSTRQFPTRRSSHIRAWPRRPARTLPGPERWQVLASCPNCMRRTYRLRLPRRPTQPPA
ncbi:hypothetical protein DL89DRAFT_175178 [Linderina pennispora]|uniref:FAR1 domain-containing protein n=1 Tax=Linderina pennispora TaxID=61395 RepID=A0A1Y1VTG1_9FUNG|nr:uncharacterized protein DL89DRAFT_175178 [Linderina pennispora]ORX64592.1 hypothetical protein DL89DRAFT_175178 [Linderina pennispora]